MSRIGSCELLDTMLFKSSDPRKWDVVGVRFTCRAVAFQIFQTQHIGNISDDEQSCTIDPRDLALV